MYDEEYLGGIQIEEGPYTGISNRLTYISPESSVQFPDSTLKRMS